MAPLDKEDEVLWKNQMQKVENYEPGFELLLVFAENDSESDVIHSDLGRIVNSGQLRASKHGLWKKQSGVVTWILTKSIGNRKLFKPGK